ncbi:hypothetical protein ACFE04_011725 [Oxalis oulophora]
MTLIQPPTNLRNHVYKFAKRSLSSIKLPGESLAAIDATQTHGIHLFKCPDSVGIVAKLSECIASKGGNILEADVFVPENNNVFYSRSEFTFDPAKWPREQISEDFNKLAMKFNAMRSVVRVPDLDPKYKIAVLASKQEHCLVDLLHKWQDDKLPLDIACVISNHDRDPNTHVIRFLQRHGIPYHYLPTTNENKRETEILELVSNTDFLVLARYMQILSGDFLSSYGKDIINIHHGLLPSFRGGHPSKQAFNAGVKLIGATSHFVTEELDAGPIIEQMVIICNVRILEVIQTSMLVRIQDFVYQLQHCYFLIFCNVITCNMMSSDYLSLRVSNVERVSHRDTLHSFVQKSENLEKQCLAKVIKSYCELRLLPYGKKTVVF